MPFYEALAKVLNTYTPMRRVCWPENEFIIFTAMTSRVLKGNGEALTIWSPSEEDLVASDWEIYDGEIF
mgnify:CR=1 FL=1